MAGALSRTSQLASASSVTRTGRGSGHSVRAAPISRISVVLKEPTDASGSTTDGATSSTWAAWASRGTGIGGWRTTIARPPPRSSPPHCRACSRIVSPMGFRPGWPGAHARRRLGLLLSGAAGALAFPTSDWSLLAWVWLVPVLVSAAEQSPRGALGDGWLAGSSFFLVLLRWLDHTFQSYSAIPWPLTWLPIAALAAYCGLYVGAMAAVVSWLGSQLGRGWGLAAAPGLWVAGEWIRGWLIGGFPWGLLGYSQHRTLAVIQIAELGGVYAVSLVIVAVNAALASWCVLGLRRSAPGATAAAVLAAGSLAFGWWVLAHEYGSAAGRQASSIEVAVIQPAIEQSLKWDPAHQAEALARYEQLTREAARSKPRVILWPETAAPIFLRGDPVLLSRLTSLSAELGVPILVGSIDRLPGPRGQFLNSAFLLGEQGIRAKYDK